MKMQHLGSNCKWDKFFFFLLELPVEAISFNCKLKSLCVGGLYFWRAWNLSGLIFYSFKVEIKMSSANN